MDELHWTVRDGLSRNGFKRKAHLGRETKCSFFRLTSVAKLVSVA